MTDSDDVVVERLPPDEAFELLAHETRFRILETLNEADGPLSFSDLRERVGVADPGQFNYHLGKMTDRFVRDADDEDGYVLTEAGSKVVGGVLSGAYTKALDADPVATDATCLACGGPMETRFREGNVEVTCTECDQCFTDAHVPPGILEGCAPEDAPDVIDSWLKRIQRSADQGFCHNCDGRLDETVYAEGDADAPEWLGEDINVAAYYDCGRCHTHWYSSVEAVVLFHPAVVAFHYDHGIDVRETPIWDLPWLEEGLATVTTEDPRRIEVPLTLDDETRVFTFDADLDLVEQRRK